VGKCGVGERVLCGGTAWRFILHVTGYWNCIVSYQFGSL